MYINVYICKYNKYIHKYVNLSEHRYTFVHICIYMYIYIHIHIYIPLHICIHTYMSTYTYMSPYTCGGVGGAAGQAQVQNLVYPCQETLPPACARSWPPLVEARTLRELGGRLLSWVNRNLYLWACPVRLPPSRRAWLGFGEGGGYRLA